MTGDDHTDALTAALRSPALPTEHRGEQQAVAAMLDALSTGEPARRRSRRGVAIAAVTVASLGVGGLAAAGPGGFFFQAAERPTSTEREATRPSPSVTVPAPVTSIAAAVPRPQDDPPVDPVVPATPDAVAGSAAGRPDVADAEACDAAGDDAAGDDATHGEVVADVARTRRAGDASPQDVRDAARSDCGKLDDSGDGPAGSGRAGDTPASTAPGRTGDTPADTAPGRTGDTPASTAPGRTGDAQPVVPADPGPPPDGPAPGSGAGGATADGRGGASGDRP